MEPAGMARVLCQQGQHRCAVNAVFRQSLPQTPLQSSSTGVLIQVSLANLRRLSRALPDAAEHSIRPHRRERIGLPPPCAAPLKTCAASAQGGPGKRKRTEEGANGSGMGRRMGQPCPTIFWPGKVPDANGLRADISQWSWPRSPLGCAVQALENQQGRRAAESGGCDFAGIRTSTQVWSLRIAGCSRHEPRRVATAGINGPLGAKRFPGRPVAYGHAAKSVGLLLGNNGDGLKR